MILRRITTDLVAATEDGRITVIVMMMTMMITMAAMENGSRVWDTLRRRNDQDVLRRS